MSNIPTGCSDGFCFLRGPATGQHTNGGCNCLRDIPMPLRSVVRHRILRLMSELAACEAELEMWRKA